MAVWNLGSINADLFYAVPHLPGPGETIASTRHHRGLGGKGTNMSVAIARAAARINHIGAVGQDGRWATDLLLEYGVDTRHIGVVDDVTGHAIIAVSDDGENQIILAPGANRQIPSSKLQAALAEAAHGDWFVTQNETNLQSDGCRLAKQMGLRIAYAAAPFDTAAVQDVLEHCDLLVLNQVEAQQLSDAMGKDVSALGVSDVVVTLGSDGADWYSAQGVHHIDAVPVQPVDTTGAGDTFTGYLIACLDRGQPMAQALQTASKAAAIMVTRHGTADVIPDLKDIEDFSR